MPIRELLERSTNRRLEFLFLLEELGHTHKDYYILNLAEMLQNADNNITIYTLCPWQSVYQGADQFKIQYSSNRILEFVCGNYKCLKQCLKALWIALHIIINPPDPKPDIIFVQTNSVVLPVLKYFGKYKLIYVYPFEEFPCEQYNYDVPRTIKSRVTTLTALFSDAILVENNYLKNIYLMSYPKHQCVHVVYPPHNIYKFANIHQINGIQMFLKRIKKTKVIFSVFGDYKKSSSHEIILDALDWMQTKSDSIFKIFVHVIICGITAALPEEQNVYFDMLTKRIQGSSFETNLTLFRLTSPADRSAIITASLAVIYPPRFEGHPGCLLETMYLKKPIIASHHGVLLECLKSRYMALLINFTSKELVSAMFQLMLDKDLRDTIASNSCLHFIQNFNYSIYCKSVKAVIQKVLNKP